MVRTLKFVVSGRVVRDVEHADDKGEERGGDLDCKVKRETEKWRAGPLNRKEMTKTYKGNLSESKSSTTLPNRDAVQTVGR